MSLEAIAAIALKAGIPLVGRILSGKLGDRAGGLATDILAAVADRAGVRTDEITALAESTPGRVIDALREVERIAPEMIAVYQREADMALAALQAEQDEPTWMRAWRPGGMYLIGLLFLWNAVILHIANAIWKIALPPMPWDTLLSVAGLYFGLYMGGHTVKDVVAKLAAKAGAAP